MHGCRFECCDSYISDVIQFDQKTKLYSAWHKDHMYTTLLPQGVEESYNRLPYSNIQISFKLSWIETLGSVLGSMLFLPCMIQFSKKGKLSSTWH